MRDVGLIDTDIPRLISIVLMVTKAAPTKDAPVPFLGLVDGQPTPQGTIVIKELAKFSSMTKAGLKVGDEIVSFGPLSGPDMEKQGKDIIAKAGVGGTIPVRIRRAGKVMDIPVKLVARKTLNLSLEDVDLELERKIAP